MSVERIAGIVAAGESETLEFKSTTGTRREATRTVCAMLNQQGGQVLFGVTPDGHPVGQQVGERTIEEIGEELGRIDPPVFPTIERISVADGREVVAVTVNCGQARPYMYRGAAYRRVGNTTIEMRADEYQRVLFERMHSEQRWENRPVDGWSVDDLDANEIRTTVEEAVRRGRLDDPGTRDPRELLRGLELFRDGILCRAAVALFGNEERIGFDFPQCLLRVARFKGTDRTEFLDNRQFHGNAFTLLRAAERFLRDSLPIAGRIEEDRFERVDEPLFPPLATREALANAFCHRDYSIGGSSVGVAIYDDRLEITSSGSLHFGLTPEKLFAPHESLPWNPLIAGAFFRRGVIERWGRGTLKMAELTADAGLPVPEIEDGGGCVTVRFRHELTPVRMAGVVEIEGVGSATLAVDRHHDDDLDDRQQAILAVLDRSDGSLALREILAGLDQPAEKRRVREDLSILKSRGLAISSGHGRGARWRRT